MRVDPLTGEMIEDEAIEATEPIDPYGDVARKAIIDANAKDASGPNWLAALSAFGSGLAGRDPISGGQAILDRQNAQRTAKISEFDKGRARRDADIDRGFKLDKEEFDASKREEDLGRMEREKDPNSNESKLAQGLANELVKDPALKSQFGGMIEGKSAAEINRILPGLQNIYETQARKLRDQEQLASVKFEREARRDERETVKEEKADEKKSARSTPYGLANTPDDAKQLKEAHESKKNFDAKIDELISLRKKNGGEIVDREAVSRAQQLSKDLLLEYKNMAKLGVLSSSDEAIINAIIPADPLQFKPFEALTGQDSILNNLQKFREDSNNQFAEKVKTRIAGGGATPVNQLVSTDSNQTKVVGGITYKKVPGGWESVE